ncbi:hypothetical protein M8J75_013767 [Diaphorina citri]|nr:hypothetical protein M8J75_013767 [Diaphorina citri]
MAFFLRSTSSLLNFRAVHIQLHRKCIHLTCVQFEQSTSSSSDSNSSSENSKDTDKSDNEADIRNTILEASLPFVHNYGWSKTAISAGAESLGYPGTTHGLFQQGGADLVHYFYATRPPHLFVHDAIRFRLELIVPYLDKWSQAMGLMALPNNTPRALANLLTMVDDVCYYAGDRSIDVTWYSRRIALAGIYKLSELYLLQDSTPDHQATWQFLRRRLEDALQLQGVLESSGSATHMAKDIATAALCLFIMDCIGSDVIFAAVDAINLQYSAFVY